MERLVTCLIVALLALGVCSLALAEDGGPAVVNPMVAVPDAAAIESQLSVNFPLPAKAEDISCHMIEDVGQAAFTENGVAYIYRVKVTPELEDISGMYEVFDSAEVLEFDEVNVTLSLKAPGMVLAAWQADGCSYSLCATEGGSEEKLLKVLIEILYA